MKNAYVITKTSPETPELARMHLDAVRDYCQKNNYTILAGTTLAGQPTEEIVEEIMARLQSMKPDVLVLFSGTEFGRDVVTAFGCITRIRDMGIEVEAVRMEIPDRIMMSAMSRSAWLLQKMAGQYAEAEDCDEDYEEEECVARELPVSSADHWIAESHTTQNKSDNRCVIYVRQNPDACFCDDIPLDEQCKQLRKYAEEQGLMVTDEVRACERGNNDTSIGLQLLQKIIAENQLNTVLVTSYNVFSDDAITCGEIIDKLKNCGVDVEPIEECSLRIRAADFFQMR